MIDLVGKLDAETAKHISASIRHANRSSELGWAFECPRYLELVRISPELLPLHDIGLQRIFDEGHHQERIMKKDLADAFVDIVDIQRDEQWGHLKISGSIDGAVTIPGVAKKDYPILEIKSCSQNNFRAASSCKTPDDLRVSRNWWLRNIHAQVQGYHLLFNREDGIILFKEKGAARKHQINSKINWDFLDALIKVLEVVNENVEKKKPRPAVRCEACKRCGFARTACFVGEDFGPGFALLADEEIEAKLERWFEIRPAAEEFKDLDKDLKDTFRNRSSIIGDFIIDSKEIMVAAQVEAKPREAYSYFKTTIEKL